MTNNYTISESFKEDICKAIRANNCSVLNDIILSESYSSLTKKEKDNCLLNLAIRRFLYLPQNIDFIKYLVFEYKISENTYQLTADTAAYSVSKKFEDMFAIRKLNEELNQELDSNNKNTKKLKV
jgi:hypothetical protein